MKEEMYFELIGNLSKLYEKFYIHFSNPAGKFYADTYVEGILDGIDRSMTEVRNAYIKQLEGLNGETI